jgi:transposase
VLRGREMDRIRELRREGVSISGIAGMTGRDRKTVRKYLREPVVEARYPRRGSRGSKLDGHKDYIEGRLRAGVWNAVVLLRELRDRGYRGGYTILKEYVAPKRREAVAVAVRRGSS